MSPKPGHTSGDSRRSARRVDRARCANKITMLCAVHKLYICSLSIGRESLLFFVQTRRAAPTLPCQTSPCKACSGNRLGKPVEPKTQSYHDLVGSGKRVAARQAENSRIRTGRSANRSIVALASKGTEYNWHDRFCENANTPFSFKQMEEQNWHFTNGWQPVHLQVLTRSACTLCMAADQCTFLMTCWPAQPTLTCIFYTLLMQGMFANNIVWPPSSAVYHLCKSLLLTMVQM